MSKDQPIDAVFIRLITDGGLELWEATLVRRNGQYWAFPQAAPTDAPPLSVDAIPLDPSLLGEPTTHPNGTRTYIYQEAVDARREATRPPPSLARLSRAAKTRTEH